MPKEKFLRCRSRQPQFHPAEVQSDGGQSGPIKRLALLVGPMMMAWAVSHMALPVGAEPAEPKRLHANSLIGEPQMPPNFKSFKWVNPDAPKGGVAHMWSRGSFDSLNGFSISGESASGMNLIYDRLMTSSPDEPTAQYALVAEWVSFPPDYSSVTFGLRPGARFHDGKPITPEDVIFTMNELKRANPRARHYYKNVVKGVKDGPHQVTFHFDVKNNRELPHIVGELVVLPKHYWEKRDLAKSSLEVPLGSGPYKVKSVDRGRSISYERVKDWWAKDLPVSRGQWNFDEIRIEYFRERTAGFEAFKAGELDFWQENSAKAWATEYEFSAAQEGLVKRLRVPRKGIAGMQAFAFNLRRPQFKDLRVRRAFVLAFNFEAMNEQLLYSQYIRTSSYFENSELKATGLPNGRELEILKEVKSQAPEGIPKEVLTAAYRNPVGGSDSAHRRNLAKASRLLEQAGWKLDGRYRKNAEGKQLTVEFLLYSPIFERHVLHYVRDLKKLGISCSVRTVDSAQYQRRVMSYDFDIFIGTFSQSISPGNEQRSYWSSAAADQRGTRNFMGIKNKAVDKLIDRIVFAKDRAELVATTRALDRVLMWNAYVIPQWHYPYTRIAFWDQFGWPKQLPQRDVSFERVWWVDAKRKKDLQRRRAQ